MSDFRPLVVIPSYNSGPLLLGTVQSVVQTTDCPVLVAVDGSTDGSDQRLQDRISSGKLRRVELLVTQPNRGKGAAVLNAARHALGQGFSHMLCMDADGQHPAHRIPAFLQAAREQPTALIMGRPRFGADVPLVRLRGRKLTIAMTDLETLWAGLGDTLFGMRVYPIAPFIRAMRQSPCAKGFDFDPEVAVRLCWMGLRPVQVDAPVRYLAKDEGGISHFNYLRDNVKLTLLHFRLIPELLLWRLWHYLPYWRAWRQSNQQKVRHDSH